MPHAARDVCSRTVNVVGGRPGRLVARSGGPSSVTQARPAASRPTIRCGTTSSPVSHGSKGSAPTASGPVPGAPTWSSWSMSASQSPRALRCDAGRDPRRHEADAVAEPRDPVGTERVEQILGRVDGARHRTNAGEGDRRRCSCPRSGQELDGAAGHRRAGCVVEARVGEAGDERGRAGQVRGRTGEVAVGVARRARAGDRAPAPRRGTTPRCRLGGTGSPGPRRPAPRAARRCEARGRSRRTPSGGRRSSATRIRRRHRRRHRLRRGARRRHRGRAVPSCGAARSIPADRSTPTTS